MFFVWKLEKSVVNLQSLYHIDSRHRIIDNNQTYKVENKANISYLKSKIRKKIIINKKHIIL